MCQMLRGWWSRGEVRSPSRYGASVLEGKMQPYLKTEEQQPVFSMEEGAVS